MTYYENLRTIREERGYTQKQIAEVLKTTRQYYNDYENGKRDIPIRIYLVLADFYKVSIDYLAGRENVIKSQITINQENNINAIGIINKKGKEE